MKKPHSVHTKGFITIIIVIVVALILLGYFGFNIRNIIESPTVQDNLHYVWDIIVSVWNTYLKAPALWIWNNILHVVWEVFLKGVAILNQNP